MLEKTKSVITVAICIVITIACVEYFLTWQTNAAASSEKMDDGFLLHDKQLGWKLRPSWRGSHSHKDFSVTYNIDRNGYRYSPIQQETTSKTVVLLGDSFTFGIGVNDNQTFSYLLNQYSLRSDKDIKFINAGTPGYSTDQEFLSLKSDLTKLNADEIILLVYLGNDLIDNQHAYPLQAEYSKPYFSLSSLGYLKLKNQPVPLIPKHGIHKQRTLKNEIIGSFEMPASHKILTDYQLGQRISSLIPFDTEAFSQHIKIESVNQIALFLAIIDKLSALTKRHDITLSVGFLTSKAAISNIESIPAVYQRTIKSGLIDRLSNKGLTTIDISIDLRQTFEETKIPLYHPNEGHLNTAGHEAVAKSISTHYFKLR